MSYLVKESLISINKNRVLLMQSNIITTIIKLEN
jgi:hypothetical protein